MNKIINTFREYFDNEVEIPEPLGESGEIEDMRRLWLIKYVVLEDQDGNPYLDFTAENRFTNPSHCRIAHDGKLTNLETYYQSFAFDPKIEGDEEQKRQAFYEHNRKIAKMLKEKGLD